MTRAPAAPLEPAPALVYGLGRSGLAAVRRLRSEGRAVRFFDARESGADVDEALALGAERTRDTLAPLRQGAGEGLRRGPALVVAAPGVPWDHPDLVALRAAGAETIGEVELAWRGTPGRYVGITGTAGKGTTTRWLADLLAAGGIDAVAGGNLDPALCDVARPGATHVVEMSSFQLERCPTFRPDVAVVLNLGSDHLDRHGSLEAYHAAKRSLLAHLGPEQAFVFDADDPTLRAWAAACPARPAGFSRSGRESADAVLDEGGVLRLHGRPLARREELRVPGLHGAANALAVALAAEALGAPDDAIRAGLLAFEGLPGRYGLAREAMGVRFLEDSIATRPLAVRAALEGTPGPIAWIAGGRSKGADAAELRELAAAKVALFVGIGEAGPAFAAALEGAVPTSVVEERDGRRAMREAVRRAARAVRGDEGGGGGGGGAVLLAPLAASFDQFVDYADRARAFRSAVDEEVASWTPSS